MMPKQPEKVCIGIPAYGTQPPDFWVPFTRLVGRLYQYDIEFLDVLWWGSMRVDGNRNTIARSFLATEADWLFWIDADNVNPVASIRRLLDTAGQQKKLVSGIYYSKQDPPETKPIVYVDAGNGRYRNLTNWERGEILPVEAAGMNCLLSHRSVFEDIDKNYVTMRLTAGGDIAIHRDDIVGDIFDNQSHPDDGKVIDGVLRQRIFPPEQELNVPFFELRYQRTEDMNFFEKARRCGHTLWVDTSVECGHLKWAQATGKEYRETSGNRPRRGGIGEVPVSGRERDDDADWLIKAR